jgi:glutaconate CoA-transferase subunit B
MATAQSYNIYELLAANISRTFGDGDVGFTGMATGSETAIFSSLVPLAAMGLAQKMHAPNMTVLLAGALHNPNFAELENIPDSECEPLLAYLDCEAMMLSFPPPWSCENGDVTCGFSGGAQVDMYGNMNSVCIGDYNKPKVRLVGPIFQTEHVTLFQREIIMMPHHDRRNFVEKVDYVSAVGWPGGMEGRKQLGLKRGGPMWIVTPKCIFDFEPISGRVRLKSVHPGITKEDIIANTGFEILGVEQAGVTPEPTQEELDILHNVVDPRGLLIPRG